MWRVTIAAATLAPAMGEIGQTLIQRGFSPEEARDMLVKIDGGAANGQSAIVDTKRRGLDRS